MLNEAYTGADAISFERIYENIMRDLMTKAHGIFGSALGENSEIIEKIDGVRYEYPAVEYGGCRRCGDGYEDGYDDDEDRDDEDDDPADGVFVVRRVG